MRILRSQPFKILNTYTCCTDCTPLKITLAPTPANEPEDDLAVRPARYRHHHLLKPNLTMRMVVVEVMMMVSTASLGHPASIYGLDPNECNVHEYPTSVPLSAHMKEEMDTFA